MSSDIARDDRTDLGERGFTCIELNRRPDKPRRKGMTEIRGPHYRPMGTRMLADLLETMGRYIDNFKFAGATFALQPRSISKTMIDMCHDHGVRVSAGGSLEHALQRRGDTVERYIAEVKDLGFDIVEVSSNRINMSADDLVRLTERMVQAGLQVKPEISIRTSLGGGVTSVDELERQGTADVGHIVALGRRHLDAGAYMLMVESEGITEDVHEWRPEVVSQIVTGIGLDRLMFEAAEPAAFNWYIRMYGPHVNLLVDHTQINHLESVRSGVGGGPELWNRVIVYDPES